MSKRREGVKLPWAWQFLASIANLAQKTRIEGDQAATKERKKVEVCGDRTISGHKTISVKLRLERAP